uniref:Uncharacterized protein n=1 Tax=Trichogramma kaykai TaxID=54128 RepID=A0ABD2WJV5_9HYME
MSDETVFVHINNKNCTKFTYNSTLKIMIPLLHKSIGRCCLKQLNTFNGHFTVVFLKCILTVVEKIILNNANYLTNTYRLYPLSLYQIYM